jgi:hypothetical protein
MSPQTHFHIRWSQLTLDGERFATREKAEERAIQLVLEGEFYTIEAFEGTCARCGAYDSNIPRGRTAASGR